MDIINFVQVSEKIASSGQPSESDFEKIAKLGYQTIINLALITSDSAIPTEGNIVTDLGMSYVHIPVQWESPTLAQFRLFSAIMSEHANLKVWVHCALNMRVSAFIYIYNKLYLGVPDEQASQKLKAVWQPNAIWEQFIETVQAQTMNKT